MLFASKFIPMNDDGSVGLPSVGGGLGGDFVGDLVQALSSPDAGFIIFGGVLMHVEPDDGSSTEIYSALAKTFPCFGSSSITGTLSPELSVFCSELSSLPSCFLPFAAHLTPFTLTILSPTLSGVFLDMLINKFHYYQELHYF